MCLFLLSWGYAQDNEDVIREPSTETKKSRSKKKKDNQEIVFLDSLKPSVVINPLAPSKAAFYSAVLPGLGQVYNKRYWKVPIVYGALGTGLGIYIWNNDRYQTFRGAYKQRIEGQRDQFQGILTDDVLIRAQRNFQRQRDLSLLATVGLYVLNIIDANVDAHLKQFNVDDTLTFSPQLTLDPIALRPQFGLTMQWSIEKRSQKKLSEF